MVEPAATAAVRTEAVPVDTAELVATEPEDTVSAEALAEASAEASEEDSAEDSAREDLVGAPDDSEAEPEVSVVEPDPL